MNKSPMPLSVKEWRGARLHRKCKYCAWLCYINNPMGGGIWRCRAKDKLIPDILPDMTSVPRLFCKLYAVKETEI